MKKALFLIFSLSIVHFGFCQWSIGLSGGIGEQRRDIPEAHLDNLQSLCLVLDINYKPDSIPIIFNLSPYFITRSVSEVFPSYNNFLSYYYSPVIIMGGVGLESNSKRFVRISTFLQLGYWHTRAEHNYYYSSPAGDQWKNFDRKFDQFAIGPRINVGFGKKKLKGTITFENYFLSSSPDTGYDFFGRERFTRISIGLSYSLGK